VQIWNRQEGGDGGRRPSGVRANGQISKGTFVSQSCGMHGYSNIQWQCAKPTTLKFTIANED